MRFRTAAGYAAAGAYAYGVLWPLFRLFAFVGRMLLWVGMLSALVALISLAGYIWGRGGNDALLCFWNAAGVSACAFLPVVVGGFLVARFIDRGPDPAGVGKRE